MRSGHFPLIAAPLGARGVCGAVRPGSTRRAACRGPAAERPGSARRAARPHAAGAALSAHDVTRNKQTAPRDQSPTTRSGFTTLNEKTHHDDDSSQLKTINPLSWI